MNYSIHNTTSAQLTPLSSRQEVKSSKDSGLEFLQSISANFASLKVSQIIQVPDSQREGAASFWNQKLEVEYDLPTVEERVEDEIESLIKQIKRLLK